MGTIAAVMARVLVTGAGGFVGAHLLPRLLEAGHDVLCLVRDGSRLEPPDDVEVVPADLLRPIDARSLGRFDAVVHLAQANSPVPEGAAELFRVNTASTAELLELARRSGGARFVLASSGSVYGVASGAVTEDAAPRAVDLYAATKRAGELLLEAYSPYLAGASTLRLFTPYGPRQTGRLIPDLIRRVRDGCAVTLVAGGRPKLTPIFVGDVARVILAALEADGHHVVNVAGDETVGMRQLAELIGRAVGREPVFTDGPGPAHGDLAGVNTRMHEVYAPGPLVPLPDGIRATVEAEAIA